MMTEHMWWPRYCPKCGGEMERWINMADEPIVAPDLFRDICSVCGHEEKVSE